MVKVGDRVRFLQNRYEAEQWQPGKTGTVEELCAGDMVGIRCDSTPHHPAGNTKLSFFNCEYEVIESGCDVIEPGLAELARAYVEAELEFNAIEKRRDELHKQLKETFDEEEYPLGIDYAGQSYIITSPDIANVTKVTLL